MKRTEFGNYLKAARLGYHWHAKMQCFVRICDAESGDRFLVHLVPDMRAMRSPPKRMREMHRCWWEGNGDPFALSDLKHVTRIKQPAILTMTDDGRVVRSEAA